MFVKASTTKELFVVERNGLRKKKVIPNNMIFTNVPLSNSKIPKIEIDTLVKPFYHNFTNSPKLIPIAKCIAASQIAPQKDLSVAHGDY